jgi:YHS domain-containing protein
MLRRELVIGYLVAGFLAVAVPASAYSAVFLSGHGLLTDLENVVVGPFIAFISFVCSIGNVPLAAALYKGGISFGGTVAFIFADLIALPLVVIYVKYYGGRLALRLLCYFWAVMSAAGLLVDLLFRAVGISFPLHPKEIAPARFEWNYTTFLNLAFLVVAAAVFWIYRNRERFGGGQQYARDPVCGMQVERGNAPATARHENTTYSFCSDRCHDRFTKDPGKFAHPYATEPAHGAREHEGQGGAESQGRQVTDPVCGMTVDLAHPGATATIDSRRYGFCGQECAEKFTAEPDRYRPDAEPARSGDHAG